jgi:hypothetical protein
MVCGDHCRKPLAGHGAGVERQVAG